MATYTIFKDGRPLGPSLQSLPKGKAEGVMMAFGMITPRDSVIEMREDGTGEVVETLNTTEGPSTPILHSNESKLLLRMIGMVEQEKLKFFPQVPEYGKFFANLSAQGRGEFDISLINNGRMVQLVITEQSLSDSAGAVMIDSDDEKLGQKVRRLYELVAKPNEMIDRLISVLREV